MRMRNRPFVAAAGLVAIFTVVGCGGGSGGGGSSVTSVSGSKSLGTLTTSEQTKLCNDAGAYIGRSLSTADFCRLLFVFTTLFSSGATDATIQADCAMAVDQCSASATSGGMSLTCDPIPTSCTATVDQFSDCVRDEVTDINQALAAIPSCNTITQASLMSGASSLEAIAPQSCTDLMNACPNYYPPVPF